MRRLFPLFPALVVLAAFATSATAQDIVPPRPVGAPLALSLDEAVLMAVERSEEVGLARSQVDLAAAQTRQAYSALFPQISANLNYTRAIQSSTEIGGDDTVVDPALIFDPDPTAPLEDRVTYLEDNAGNAALGAIGGLFSGLPFGQKNTYAATISLGQTIYSPQLGAGIQIAKHFREAAGYNLTEELADIRLQVQQAYIQALVAQELVVISQAAIVQAQSFLDTEQLRLTAGTNSELEVLRAQVELENLRPQLVQAQNAAELAVLDLKRLTNLPYGQPVALTTPLTLPAPDELENVALDAEALVSGRAAILAAEEQVAIAEQQVRLKRAAYLPSVSFQANYGRQLFTEEIFDFGGEWRPDFTVGVGVSVPIFNGFRRSAEVQQARVELSQAEFQTAQLREAVQLQAEQALGEKRRARALIAARQQTIEQAGRVYRLTGLQYDEGLSTPLEVSDARLSLLQARTNLVQALADFYNADANLLRAGTSTGTGGTLALPDGQLIPELPPLDTTRPTTTDTAPTPNVPTPDVP
ncbi:MAG: TolC family protein [Rhodothermales bacterium]